MSGIAATTALVPLPQQQNPSVAESQRMAWYVQRGALLQAIKGLQGISRTNQVVLFAKLLFSGIAATFSRQPARFDHQIFIIRAAHLFIGSGSNNKLARLFEQHVGNPDQAIDAFTAVFKTGFWEKVKDRCEARHLELSAVVIDVNAAYKKALQYYQERPNVLLSIQGASTGIPSDLCKIIASYVVDDQEIGNEELINAGMTINETVVRVQEDMQKFSVSCAPAMLLLRIQGIFQCFYLNQVEKIGRTEPGCPVVFMRGRIVRTEERGQVVYKLDEKRLLKWEGTAPIRFFHAPEYREDALKALADHQVWPPATAMLSVNQMAHALRIEVLFAVDDPQYQLVDYATDIM